MDESNYVSIKTLSFWGYVSYDSHAKGREIADEEWAEKVLVSPGRDPGSLRLNVTCVNYTQDGFSRADFHIFPDGPVNSIKGDIRNYKSSGDEVQVNHQNIILHMNPLKDDNSRLQLEVVVNRVAQ